jgi:hypothetical protein
MNNGACFTYDDHYKTLITTQGFSSDYKTHTSIHAERLHSVSQALFLPGRLFLQNMARVIEPTPGQYKDHMLWRLIIRIVSFVYALLWAVPALVLSLPALGLARHRSYVSSGHQRAGESST